MWSDSPLPLLYFFSLCIVGKHAYKLTFRQIFRWFNPKIELAFQENLLGQIDPPPLSSTHMKNV